MSHDRTGARLDGDERPPIPCRCGRPGCPCERPGCRGWLTPANADKPKPCPACKPHLADDAKPEQEQRP